MRKICVVTGTRAEYGLLRWVMDGIKADPSLTLQVVVTGMHLSERFGNTYLEIENDGFAIDRKVEIGLASDSPVGISNSIAACISGMSRAFDELKPDLMVVLGDRFEILAASIAGMIARIPIAHLHGGERTEGLIDEPIRHSITKMSHLHFVAAEEYRQRVIQLGEQPDHVFLVGGLGIDNIKKIPLLDRAPFEESIDFKLRSRNLLVTFHPVTLEGGVSHGQFAALLDALDSLEDTGLIFTMPNADTDGATLYDMVNAFVSSHDNAKAFISLGQLRYLSAIRHVDGVVGNSSSGLIEVPSFQKGTIDIGDRQRGRIKAESVISCQPSKSSILAALSRMYSPAFQAMLPTVINPYGDGGASARIVEVIAKIDLTDIIKKPFYDLVAP